MKSIFFSKSAFFAIGLWLIAATTAWAQPATPTPPRKFVYVTEVTQSEPSPKHGDLRQFVTKLLQLQLSGSKDFQAIILRNDAPCAINGLPAPTPDSPTGNPASFYLVKASLDVRLSTEPGQEAEIILAYELFKYEQCQSTLLTHDTTPSSETSIMKQLNSMATVVALFLEFDAQRPAEAKATVIVKPGLRIGIQPTQAAQAKQVADELLDNLVTGLNQKGGFEVRVAGQGDLPASAAYILQPILRFASPDKAEITFELTYDQRQYRSRESINGPSIHKKLQDNDWLKFYDEAAKEAVDFMNAVKAKLDQPLGNEAFPELLQKTLELIRCQDESKKCQAQHESALPLVIELTKNRRADFTQPPQKQHLASLDEWLGQVYLKQERFLEAAEAFSSAADQLGCIGPDRKSENRKRCVSLLNQSGDTWYSAKNYKEAAKYYDESLKWLPTSPAQFAIHLKRAKSRRFADARLEALDDLLDSLSILPQQENDADVLAWQKELYALLEDLRDEDRTQVTAKLTAAPNGSGQPEKGLAFLKALDWLHTAATSTAEAMDEALREANKVLDPISELLPPSTKSQWLRLRGLSHKRHKEFGKAVNDLKVALETDNSLTNQYELGDAYFGRGQQKFEKGQPQSVSEAKEDYKKAASLFKDLTKAHYSDAYAMLRKVNHLLRYIDPDKDDHDKDDDTKDLLEEVLSKNPQDVEAIINLQSVYKYLGKFVNTKNNDAQKDDPKHYDAREMANRLVTDSPRRINDRAITLNLAETYLLSKEYAAAERWLAEADQHRYEDDQRAVLRFDQALLRLAQNREGEARAAYQDSCDSYSRWYKKDESTKKNTTPWELRPTKLYLHKEKFPSQWEDRLQKMLDAMIKQTEPPDCSK